MSNKQYLARASFEGIEFPVLDATSTHGHDRALFQAFKVNGAEVQTTGLKPASGKISVALSGNLPGYEEQFPTLFGRLCKAFADHPLGVLLHPVYGLMEVHIDQWDDTFKAATTSGPASFDFTWIEVGSPSAGLFEVSDDDGAPSTTAAGEKLNDDAAAADDAVVRNVPIATQRPAPVAPVIATQTTFLETAPRGYLAASAAIGEMRTALNAALNHTSIAGVDGFEARTLLTLLRTTLQQYSSSYLADRKARRYVTQTILSVSQIAALAAVYGDARKVPQLLASNRFVSMISVPAGTVVTVLDGV